MGVWAVLGRRLPTTGGGDVGWLVDGRG